MSKMQVLFTAEANNELLQELKPYCDFSFKGWNQGQPVIKQDDVLISLLKDKQIFVTSYDSVTRNVLDCCPKLKLIICTRSTPANIDLQAAQEKGVVVCTTPGRNADATAEFAVALLLNVARNISFANRAILEKKIVTDDLQKPATAKKDMTWPTVKGVSPYLAYQGVQIKNKNVGIVGFGAIGRRVAKILAGFDARILVYDPFVSGCEINSPSMQKVDFDELLAQADFISCHTKVNDSTRGMFCYDTFCKMKRTAYFINNSRGAIVVEEDLIRALREKKIQGAALDVFDYEPLYEGHPFLSGEFEHLLITPHISGASPDAIINGTQMLVEEIRRYVSRQPLLYRVNK